MQKEEPNNQNKPGGVEKEGYVVVPNYFLREWVKPQSQVKFQSKSQTFFHSCKTKNIRTYLLPS